jgi:fibro-slime domain-containing protein
MGAMAASLIAGAAWAQAPDNVLTGVARDFEELKWKQATGGHPDFNPTWNTHVTWDPNGAEGWGCFDKPEAAKGAVQPAPVTSDPNPDKLAGFVPYDRDEVGPALKAGYDTPPNCFRSRFGEWYTTRTPDINRAFFVDLPFVKEGSVYKYDNSEFFPLDDDKRAALRPQVPSVTTTFGHRQTGVSEGIDLSKHNYGFTFEFHAKFAYHKSTGQNFAFRGDDDVWVFINDKLVIDLGGLHAAEYAEVNLDTLGLEDGKPYFLDFYFAERRIEASRLTITTSLELKNPDKPLDPTPVKATEAWLYDRDGDGIADKAEIAFDKPPAKAPGSLELDLAGEAERGNWDVTLDGGKAVVLSRGDFFTKPATGWDESDPRNRGKTFKEPAAGLSDGDFVLHDRIGPVIDKAWKLFQDTSLSQVPQTQIQIRFSEPVTVGAPTVLKFQDPSGAEKQVDVVAVKADSTVDGRSVSWTFTIAPGSPNVPGEGWKVAIASVDQVKDAAGNPAHPANPWRPIEAKPPRPYIGTLRAEKGGTPGELPDPAGVKNPFVILTSDAVTATHKDYIPLHPETAEDWIRRNTGETVNPGMAVFGIALSHPANIKLAVYDNLGQFVNRTEMTVTREDLQSGKLGRDPSTRAYLLRFGWVPLSEDGRRISTGAYILRATFTYGLDPRDYVERGSRTQVTRFGYVRDAGLRGLGLP